MPPTNTTPATALEITSVPSTVTQQALSALWFKHTPQAGRVLLYVGADLGLGSDAAYNPTVSVFIGPVDNLTERKWSENGADLETFTQATGGGYYLRLPVVGEQTYYFQVRNDDDDPVTAGAICAFSILEPPNLDAPTFSAVIPDDSQGFPAAVLDLTTGAFLQFPRFPAGENTDTLPTGEILTQGDYNDSRVDTYLDQVWISAASFGYASSISAIKSCRPIGKFFVLVIDYDGVTRKLYRFKARGNYEATWTLPNNGHFQTNTIAISNDGTRLYAAHGGNGDNIYVFHMTGSFSGVEEAPLAVGLSSWWFTGHGDGLVLPDGSLLFARQDYTLFPNSKFYLQRFHPTTGAVLQTIDCAPIVTGNHWCYVDDDRVLVWGYPLSGGNGFGTFKLIRLSTGATLATWTASIVGTSSATAEAYQPNAASNSCPLFVIPAPWPKVPYSEACEHLQQLNCVSACSPYPGGS